MAIEGACQAVELLPIKPSVLATLRESARLHSTHYSTAIEGNRLTQDEQDEVVQLVKDRGHFPGRERDGLAVLGYYGGA